MLREFMVPHHPGYVQILDDYHVRLAVADDPLRHLVYRILPGVGHLLMEHCYLMFELLPVLRTLLLSCQHPLEMFQPFLMLLQYARILIIRTIRADCETLEVQVHAYDLWLLRLFWNWCFNAIIEEA